jgi:hypothetical protein
LVGGETIAHEGLNFACQRRNPRARYDEALTISPRIGSGAPTTATKSTAGCARIQSSISVGPIRYPPLLMRSSSRPLYQN